MDDPEELTPEELAALDAYEQSAEGQAEDADRRARLDLHASFMKLPTMRQHRRFVEEVHEGLQAETVPVTIEVSKAFLRMLAYIDALDAGDGAGEPPVEVLLAVHLDNKLHELLHQLAASPGSFRRYRDLWNNHCDEKGMPGEKIGTAAAPVADADGPF